MHTQDYDRIDNLKLEFEKVIKIMLDEIESLEQQLKDAESKIIDLEEFIDENTQTV